MAVEVAAALGAVAGCLALLALGCVGMAVRWHRQAAERRRNRHVQLQDLASSFTFGAQHGLQAGGHAGSRALANGDGGHDGSYEPPGASSTRTPQPSPARRERSSPRSKTPRGRETPNGGNGEEPITPLNWTLSVSSPAASTC